MKIAWVYILECADGSYYTGMTTNLEARLYEHQHGVYHGYTASRRPVKLLWYEQFPTVDQAFQFERQVKGWSRAKKEALMRGDFELLSKLAECKNETRLQRKPKGIEKRDKPV